MTAVLKGMIPEQECFSGQHKAILENVSNVAGRDAPSSIPIPTAPKW